MSVLKELKFKNIDLNDLQFQMAFHKYFAEYGITLKPDTDVFDELIKAEKTEGLQSIGLMHSKELLGFVLYQIETFESNSSFFKQKVGYIREIWVNKDYRGQKLGTKLMEEVYTRLRNVGVCKVLLTYDEDAIGFYEKLGYEYDDSYEAKNKLKCIVKVL